MPSSAKKQKSISSLTAKYIPIDHEQFSALVGSGKKTFENILLSADIDLSKINVSGSETSGLFGLIFKNVYFACLNDAASINITFDGVSFSNVVFDKQSKLNEASFNKATLDQETAKSIKAIMPEFRETADESVSFISKLLHPIKAFKDWEHKRHQQKAAFNENKILKKTIAQTTAALNNEKEKNSQYKEANNSLASEVTDLTEEKNVLKNALVKARASQYKLSKNISGKFGLSSSSDESSSDSDSDEPEPFSPAGKPQGS